MYFRMIKFIFYLNEVRKKSFLKDLHGWSDELKYGSICMLQFVVIAHEICWSNEENVKSFIMSRLLARP